MKGNGAAVVPRRRASRGGRTVVPFLPYFWVLFAGGSVVPSFLVAPLVVDAFSFLSMTTTTSNLYNHIPKRRTITFAPTIQRVLCISDIHTDYEENLQWVQSLYPCKETLLIVAGDVSHKLNVVQETFEILREKFGEVMYIPGNHDLWTVPTTTKTASLPHPEEDPKDSLRKLISLYRICDDVGIRTGPVRVGTNNNNQNNTTTTTTTTATTTNTDTNSGVLWILPVLSWHHQSFDTEPDIDPNCWGRIPNVERVVSDYRRTSWPEPLASRNRKNDNESIARFFDDANDHLLGPNILKDILQWENAAGSTIPKTTQAITHENNNNVHDSDMPPIMTFSHFLPRIELTPEKRYLPFPTLNKAVGSVYLESRIRKLGSRFHFFGHTHFGWDCIIDGIRYVQAPLAYPKERKMRPRSLTIGTLDHTGNQLQPICVWDVTKYGGFINNDSTLGGSWSDRYKVMDRRPEITDTLAPWVANRYKQLEGGKIEYFKSR